MSVAAPPPVTQPVLLAPPLLGSLRRFSVAEYHRMIETEILTDEDKVELLNGYVVLKMPRNPPHDVSVMTTPEALRQILPAGWCIRSQCAITLATSEPEPDVAIARGTWRDYATQHPTPSMLGLIVEVADSTLQRDRDEKGQIYADARLPAYWIVNVVDRIVEVYSAPTGSGLTARYSSRQDHLPADSIPLILDGVQVGVVHARDLLP